MKTSVLILMAVALLTLSLDANGGEPPGTESLKDKVRMSTLIVVGNVVRVIVYDTKSKKIAKPGKYFRPGEQERATIKVERLLYSAPSEGNGPGERPVTVDVIFGQNRWSVKEPSETKEIFFLTRNTVPQPGVELEHYPFFNWTNLTYPLEKEAEVARIIAAFEAIK